MAMMASSFRNLFFATDSQASMSVLILTRLHCLEAGKGSNREKASFDLNGLCYRPPPRSLGTMYSSTEEFSIYHDISRSIITTCEAKKPSANTSESGAQFL